MDVAIIAGSESDMPMTEEIAEILRENGFDFDTKVISAHREPNKLDKYLSETDAKVLIAIAGLSAALPGVIASKTDRPVIGVPISTRLMGLDALLSMAQVPSGVPVGVVGIDNGKNAALLAIRILNL